MSAATRVRVEARRLPPYASDDDRYREGLMLQKRFKRACNEFGISHMIKEKEYFIRPCDKRRQKKSRRLLAILRAQNPIKVPPKELRPEF
jgi:ribosomal protein S21